MRLGEVVIARCGGRRRHDAIEVLQGVGGSAEREENHRSRVEQVGVWPVLGDGVADERQRLVGGRSLLAQEPGEIVQSGPKKGTQPFSSVRHAVGRLPATAGLRSDF